MVKTIFEKMFFEKNVSVELFFDDLYFFTFYIFPTPEMSTGTVRGQFSSLHIFNSLYHCVYVTQPPLSNA